MLEHLIKKYLPIICYTDLFVSVSFLWSKFDHDYLYNLFMQALVDWIKKVIKNQSTGITDWS